MSRRPTYPRTWCRAALWLTTSRLAYGTAPYGGFALARDAGWTLRTASPSWAAVWRNHPETQHALKAIVLPRPWRGTSDPIWRSLLGQRLYEFGISTDKPDPWLLRQAEREVYARLAPPWTKMMAGPYE
ncbi:hypothetical protein CEW89_09615 [Celeribacter ethanolicus]|uniref:Uncharacterized protein n=1 Tax=Celeribacter ethanolicus TaxID=1758178 RepID=A0A291GCC4_9RHOB|nr:hypothetical protein [Celeribacter ethanolicus]ATG47798.1 hypothetical protein CEW89_09615 [Celeribacter ethanolicus]